MIFDHAGIRKLALASVAVLALAGCADDDDVMTAPGGSAFTQALAADYTDLAAQTAALPAGPGAGDDGFFAGMFDWFSSPDNPNDALVTAFTDKASIAQSGTEPTPEAPSADPAAQGIRARLMRDLAAGKEQFPEQAARAQADYDCWILDSGVPSAASAAQACRTALDGSLLALENAVRPAPAPVASAPVAPPPAPAPAASDFTVYYDFDSWTLTAEDLAVITSAVNTARSGGQSHISVVGHTDTSGAADYNQRLSVHRASVVVEAMVDMGARRAAITASGVGETDLAVDTPDGVKEAKNRRAVITLQP